MRDIFKAIARVEHTVTRGLERPVAAPEKRPKPSSRVWRAPTTDTRYPEQIFKRKDKPVTRLAVAARALKVTAMLDAAVVTILPTPDGQARSDLVITCDGKTYVANIATKSLRKAKATIAANGAENTFVTVQGKLKGNEIAECGLVAQAKARTEAKERLGDDANDQNPARSAPPRKL
jgi:hypothetical protein